MIDNPTTVTDLAALLKVNRRRIAKWRASEHAPSTLDLAEWRRWLTDSGRTKIADRIDTAAAPLDGHAPKTAAAAHDHGDATPSDPRDEEIQRPLPDAGPAVWEKYWKARNARQVTLDNEQSARIRDRDLIPQQEVLSLLRAMATAQLDALGDSIWLALRLHLDGVPDTLRKTLRTAHDQAVLAMRARLGVVLRDKFTALTNPPAKPA